MTVLPVTQRQAIGSIKIKKGNDYEGKSVISWDPIPECEGNNCPIAGICNYDPKVRCTIMMQWMSTFYETIAKEYPNLSEDKRYLMGTLLAPAWKELCLLYIVQMSIPLSRTYLVNQQGNWKAHAVFDDVRKQRQHITHLLKEIGFDGEKIKIPSPADLMGNAYGGPVKRSALQNPNL